MLSRNNLSVERLNNGHPILSAIKEHAWENEVVFNPACVLLEEKSAIEGLVQALSLAPTLENRIKNYGGVCVLIYRAQGTATKTEDYRRSRLGIALLTPTLELIYRHPQPVLTPEEEYEDLGVEDPRITKIDGKYVMFYTGYSSHGKLKEDRSNSNKINICIAYSDNLVNWEKKGPLKGELNEIDNKNAVLFPDKIGGAYYLLHRPMGGKDPMTVHFAHSDSILGEWRDDGMIMDIYDDPKFTKSWIGAGAPPLAIGENEYLALYHTGHFKRDDSREYDLGLCRLKFDGKLKVHERIEPLMTPQTDAETIGNRSLGVNNVLFACGAYFFGNHLYFPYAGADSVILAARMGMKSLREDINRV